MINKLKTKYALETLAFAFVFAVLVVPVLASDITAEKVIELVNIERQKRNAVALSHNETLSRVAEDKAKDMIEKNYFAHTSPEGKTPWYWYEKENYDYKYAGENLAINFVSAEKQMEAWMKSETHRKNILSENFTEMGVAVASGKIDGKDVIITVQEFGKSIAMETRPADEKDNFVFEKNIVPQEKTEIVPMVLSESEPAPGRRASSGEIEKSLMKIQIIEFIQNFFMFLTFLAVAVSPMVFLAKSFEKLRIIWEGRERDRKSVV
jgi:uncharacterized protein YkwD